MTVPNGALDTPWTTIDSGSTFTYFTTTLYNNIINQIRAQCPSCSMAPFSNFGIAFALTPSSYPTIVLTFQDITLTFPGSSYFVASSRNSGFYFAGFTSIDPTTGISGIIGVSFLTHFYTVFDVAHQRVGFGPVNAALCTGFLAPSAPLSNVAPSTPHPPVTDGAFVTPLTPRTCPFFLFSPSHLPLTSVSL